MAQSAMSATIWDGEWGPLSYKLDDWLLFKDELEKKEVDDPSCNLTKHEIAEQVLHNIEDLGRNYNADWLDEFPLFDELQSLPPVEETGLDLGRKSENLKPEPEQSCPVVAAENQQQPTSQDLFSVSYENAATFILTNENIVYIDDQPFVNLSPFRPLANTREIKCKEEKVLEKEPGGSGGDDLSEDGSLRPGSWSDPASPDARSEMEVVDEILRNTALELDSQWESDTSRSESSSSDETSSESLPKKRKHEGEDEEQEEEGGEGEETDDPDWRPESVNSGERGTTCPKRSKRHKRGGSQEEKKLRKKEQNKNAATRYRQKKKAEVDEILKEEKILRERKTQLEEKAADIQNEIKCVKALMRDLFKAKGFIN